MARTVSLIDPRPIAFVIGILLCVLAAAMLVPCLLDLAMGSEDWTVFALSSSVTLFVGAALAISSRGPGFTLKIREAFILTTLTWLVLAAFAALPFHFSALELSYADAFFESMSGITTTGSTVIVGLDTVPPGLLLWRAILQWLGGIGIIVMALSILPMLRVGGMQLFRMESSDTSEKVLPRAAEIASSIGAIYTLFTLICMIAYAAMGMTPFDAAAHAMTTIATGGFSTKDLSLGHWGSAQIETVAIVFMLIGSLPFVLYLKAVRGRPWDLFRDSQVRWFLSIVAVIVAAMTTYLLGQRAELDLASAFRLAAFNVVSIITGTGYATSDFGLWGAFALPAFLFIMFIGGCAGSTTCGIKVFRFQVLYATVDAQLKKLLHPHGVHVPYYQGKPIPESVSESVMSFFFAFVLCFVLVALGLGLLGLDLTTAVSGAATAIANVGPGLGEVIGPAGNFAPLPEAAKWLLSFAMLLGRLELFTVLVLLVPAFWRD